MAGGVVLPSGTVTFLFTDIEGSTRLWEAYPAAMRSVVERHDRMLRQVIESYGGYVFAAGGDGFSAAFGRASDAVAAAVAAQESLRAEPWPEQVAIRVRMGVHTGEAQERDGNYFGPALNQIGRLHAAGHGGQILLSDATEALVRAEVQVVELGWHRLRDLGDPVMVFQVVADGLPRDFPPLRSVESMANNLPLAVDEFVGRDDELRDVIVAVEGSRLVSLTGVGGSGKTRLALEAAAFLLPRYPDGVWLVELAPLSEPDAVPFVVGDVVGAAQQPGLSMLDSLVGALTYRRMLLVLDNCEHLLGAVADLVVAVESRCAGVAVLVTSRAGLGVRGEQIMAVPSLNRQHGAELFVLRARAAGGTVESNDPTVGRMVDRLDGLPLAIELAAARTPH